MKTNISIIQKKVFTSLFSLFIFTTILFAQEPNIYIHSLGEVIYKKPVSQIDSVIFYKKGNGCGAFVSPGIWKDFMCHNLGAVITADPFIPDWKLNGDYYQWGKKNYAAIGPAGAGEELSYSGAITGWNMNSAINGSWSDNIKTDNDPCPVGFRVPTKADWKGVLENNTITYIGTWSTIVNNYSSGVKYGAVLYLPASGFRDGFNGLLQHRGSLGYYSSSTESDLLAYQLSFQNLSTSILTYNRITGFPVRCITDFTLPPKVTTTLPTSITETSAISGGNIINDGGVNITARGVCWNIASSTTLPTTNDFFTNDGINTGSFTSQMNGLTPFTTYSLRAYATNIAGPGYGDVVQFTTLWISDCGAYINNGVWKKFMCHNLGADQAVNPNSPSWKINGDYYQWGIKAPAAFGPVGPDASQTNGSSIAGWNITNAPNQAWSENAKTENDPCPEGFRVPTKSQWDEVALNNTIINEGSWSNSSTNYNTGKKIGSKMYLPAAGNRDNITGELKLRGIFGFYSSSTESFNTGAWCSYLNNSTFATNNYARTNGFSVRCISADKPVVFTTVVNKDNINQTSAVLAGNVTNDNGSVITARGICWSLVDNPSVSDNKTVEGVGIGLFTSTLSDLLPGKKYYFKAYATNKIGTAYGVQKEFYTKTLCGAYISVKDEWKEFLCHNLGADPTADPFTPNWKLNGDYYQWGKKSTAAVGPTGPDDAQANSASIMGWINTASVSGSWTDAYKTPNDPCPVGYRLPTKEQWINISGNNTITALGTWNATATNYSSGQKIGNSLYLPAAGVRYNEVNGELYDRGFKGYYWSSTENTDLIKVGIYSFSNVTGATGFWDFRANALSVRCMKE